MKIEPYLNFDGRCEEAIEFYRGALDAELVMLMRMKDNPEAEAQRMIPPGAADKVLHAAIRIGDSTLLASDMAGEGRSTFHGITLALTTADDAEAERRFAALADGGQVQQALITTFFSSRFGVVADRFGVAWMIVVAQ